MHLTPPPPPPIPRTRSVRLVLLSRIAFSSRDVVDGSNALNRACERRFRREMAESKTLGEAILVPQVYTALNTRYILVTEWVEGVKVRVLACAHVENANTRNIL